VKGQKPFFVPTTVSRNPGFQYTSFSETGDRILDLGCKSGIIPVSFPWTGLQAWFAGAAMIEQNQAGLARGPVSATAASRTGLQILVAEAREGPPPPLADDEMLLRHLSNIIGCRYLKSIGARIGNRNIITRVSRCIHRNRKGIGVNIRLCCIYYH
jgi:hypothetical protein